MKLPCDLVAFMRQEEGSGMPEKLKEELLSRKDAYEIDKNDDRDTGMNKILFFLMQMFPHHRYSLIILLHSDSCKLRKFKVKI